jgi:ribonuclease P protein component
LPGWLLTSVERLRGSRQFSDVFAHGRRFALGHVVLVVRHTDGGVRWGIVVGKRVGAAVVRNRVRRRLREICRTVDAAVRGSADIVVIAQPSAAAADYGALLGAVAAALGRSKLVNGADVAARRGRGAPSRAAPKAGPR